MSRFLRAAVLLFVVGTACQAPDDTATTVPVTTTAPPGESAGSQVYEMLALATHPNGMQVRVDRVEVLSDSVVVSGSVTNGSSYGISLDRGVTQLTADTGEVSSLIEGLPDQPIPPGGEVVIALRFNPLTNPSAVTLTLNSGQGSSRADPSTSSPTVELGPIALDSEISRPPLPDPIPLRRSVAALTGVELQIEGINFTENRIGVWVRIANPGLADASIAPTIAPSLLVDDLDNRYPLVLPEREGSMVIPAGSARSGVLAFAGRIHPDATILGLGLNAGAGGDTGDGSTIYPKLIAEGIPLAGDEAIAPLPNSVEAPVVGENVGGIRVELSAMTFSEDSSSAELVVVNSGSHSVAMAALPTYMVDDQNIRYPLVAPAGNPQLTLDSGTSIEGTFAFSGRIADTATQITIVFNNGGSLDDPSDQTPSIALGPFVLDRPTTPARPVEPKVFAVGARSRLVDDVLASSQVEQITQTLTQFGATEVEGGFKLTLPDSILFDFNSSVLRPDAAQALTLIADVLRYFEGDQVIVIGHTDSVGSSSYNQHLSELRAQSVVDTLVTEGGIAVDRLTAEGRGADEPIAPNATPDGQDNPDGRQLNRRVEIVVITDRDLPLP
jgi:outer membrane protein OmpA-like peptidoglycan-associated protein